MITSFDNIKLCIILNYFKIENIYKNSQSMSNKMEVQHIFIQILYKGTIKNFHNFLRAKILLKNGFNVKHWVPIRYTY